MRRMKLVVSMIAALAAMSAFASAQAMAGETPVFHVGAGVIAKTEPLTAVANGNQVLKATGVEIVCPNLAATGNLLVSSTNEETLTYSGCKVTGHASCVAKSPGAANNGEIVTNLLSSKLAWATKEAAELKTASGNNTVTVFTPKTGEVFVNIELTPLGECGFTPTEAAVKGSVIVTNVGAATLAKTQEISSTGAEKYFTNPGAVESKGKLTAFGLAASYKGKSQISLTSGSEWGVF
jgi:hypothetical protein